MAKESENRLKLILQTDSKRLTPFVILLLVFSGCIWLVLDSTSPELPSSEEVLLYSNQAHQNLRLTFLKAIESSQKSIHLVMFGLSDPEILQALSRTKVKTTVYYDPSGSPQLRPHLSVQFAHCQFFPVQSSGLMHQKILVIDEEMIFIGSANMTPPSLTMHDNLVIGLKNRDMARFLLEKAALSPGYLRSNRGQQDVELWLLPDPEGQALQNLRKKIQSAQKSISIALFTFTHLDLIEEMISAHNRGIAVHLVVDLHSGLGASKKAIEKIKQAGIQVSISQGIQLLHHKFVLIDGQTLITGSANWTKAAFTKNHDCLLALQRLNKKQKKFMQKLWKRIEAEARSI